jgi:hypothetical protein
LQTVPSAIKFRICWRQRVRWSGIETSRTPSVNSQSTITPLVGMIRAMLTLLWEPSLSGVCGFSHCSLFQGGWVEIGTYHICTTLVKSQKVVMATLCQSWCTFVCSLLFFLEHLSSKPQAQVQDVTGQLAGMWHTANSTFPCN